MRGGGREEQTNMSYFDKLLTHKLYPADTGTSSQQPLSQESYQFITLS